LGYGKCRAKKIGMATHGGQRGGQGARRGRGDLRGALRRPGPVRVITQPREEREMRGNARLGAMTCGAAGTALYSNRHLIGQRLTMMDVLEGEHGKHGDIAIDQGGPS